MIISALRMRLILFAMSLALCNLSFEVCGQTADSLMIKQLLHQQQGAWNRGDVDSFMKGYWESDSLLFIGRSGLNYGYSTTLNNYRKNYPDTAAMGKLTLEVLHMKRLSVNYYFVVGQWHLRRSIGDVGGHFSLLLRKIKKNWKIVADHSS